MRPALCVRIKRRDGLILRTTSSDTDLDITAAGYEGTYRSVAALAPSEMQFRPTLAVDGMDVSGILAEATGISERDVAAGVYDQARVTVFETNLADLSQVKEWVWGVLGKKVRTEEGSLQMEVRTISQLMNQNQGEVWQTRCRADLGSGDEAPILRRCGVDMTDFTFDETVTGVLDPRKAFIVATLGQPAGFFSKGKVTWVSGENAGAVREIRIHDTPGVMLLYDPLPFDIQAGDDIVIQAGCDKTFETCRDKFDNAENFQGEPYIPGPAFMTRNNSTPGSVKHGSTSLLGSIVQIAATVVGSFFGAIGAFVGSLIGGILAPGSGGSTVGPRADDLRITSGTEGVRIAYVAGRYAVSGNVITDIEVIEEKRTRRVGRSLLSSGTKVTEFFYFFTNFVALGEGEMDVMRVWVWGKLVYDVRPPEERDEEFLARAEEFEFDFGVFGNISGEIFTDLNAEFLEHATIYRGTDDQEPDPILVEHYGDGNVPSFRGRAGIMFDRFPLEPFQQGATPPQLLVEVCRVIPEIGEPEPDEENEGGVVSEPVLAWDLPESMALFNGGSLGVRQFAKHSAGYEIQVTDLPAGLTYNSSLERIEADSEADPASATATFTLVVPEDDDLVETRSVSLVTFVAGTRDDVLIEIAFNSWDTDQFNPNYLTSGERDRPIDGFRLRNMGEDNFSSQVPQNVRNLPHWEVKGGDHVVEGDRAGLSTLYGPDFVPAVDYSVYSSNNRSRHDAYVTRYMETLFGTPRYNGGPGSEGINGYRAEFWMGMAIWLPEDFIFDRGAGANHQFVEVGGVNQNVYALSLPVVSSSSTPYWQVRGWGAFTPFTLATTEAMKGKHHFWVFHYNADDRTPGQGGNPFLRAWHNMTGTQPVLIGETTGVPMVPSSTISSPLVSKGFSSYKGGWHASHYDGIVPKDGTITVGFDSIRWGGSNSNFKSVHPLQQDEP